MARYEQTLDSADSNYRGAKEAFLDRVPIPADQVLTLDPALAPAQAAMMYEARMRALGAEILPKSPSDPTLPRVDLVLLGIGPDGHVASLFPNHPLTSATEGWALAITDSPKPPPERITPHTLKHEGMLPYVTIEAYGAKFAGVASSVIALADASRTRFA